MTEKTIRFVMQRAGEKKYSQLLLVTCTEFACLGSNFTVYTHPHIYLPVPTGTTGSVAMISSYTAYRRLIDLIFFFT